MGQRQALAAGRPADGSPGADIAAMRAALRRAAARLSLYSLGAAGVAFATLAVYQAWSSRSLPALQPWHRWAPPAEMRARELGPGVGLGFVLEREERVFAQLRSEIEERVPAAQRTLGNRYWRESLAHASRFARDWNRTYEVAHAGAPRCGALLVHGLTDSPYSMRSLARVFADEGCVALALRMPGHGTTPAALLEAEWEDWAAAVRVGWRDLARRLGPERPLFLVGYSNGGALALDAALDGLDGATLPRARGVVLLSPMIGVAMPAQLARVAGALGVVPGLEKARWDSVLPEFNPFKYQSFPLRAAGESARLTRHVAARLRGAAAGGRGSFPPVLAFQSAVDATVSARAVVDDLFARLPRNGSELVLYNVARRSDLRPFFLVYPDELLAAAAAAPRRAFRLTVIGNRDPQSDELAARSYAPEANDPEIQPLDLAWRADVYSLSHVALPFPPDDPLYGSAPDEALGGGLRLGLLVPRGERGQLGVSAEQWTRLGCNPFWSDLERRVREWTRRRLAD